MTDLMDIPSRRCKELSGTDLPVIEPDYSDLTLIELFTARYWMDKFPRERSLENEIHKRCEHIQQQVTGNIRATGTRSFKPYGLRVAVIFFCLTIGPFLTFTYLNAISLIKGGDDTVILSGVWAILTLPALVLISMIGGRIDAERVIKSFHLSGAKSGANKNYFYEVINAL
jgi:hypothetical protein